MAIYSLGPKPIFWCQMDIKIIIRTDLINKPYPKITIELNDNFNLSPRGIREMLSLNKPIYECTSAYGHFGRKPGLNGEFSWEKTDKTAVFKK